MRKMIQKTFFSNQKSLWNIREETKRKKKTGNKQVETNIQRMGQMGDRKKFIN